MLTGERGEKGKERRKSRDESVTDTVPWVWRLTWVYAEREIWIYTERALNDDNNNNRMGREHRGRVEATKEETNGSEFSEYITVNGV